MRVQDHVEGGTEGKGNEEINCSHGSDEDNAQGESRHIGAQIPQQPNNFLPRSGGRDKWLHLGCGTDHIDFRIVEPRYCVESVSLCIVQASCKPELHCRYGLM